MTRDSSTWLSCLQLAIRQPGADLRERLHDELRDVKARELQLVEATIDLRSRGAAAAVDVLEDLGFFATGLRPGGSGADQLLLQYFNGSLVDYDGMVMDTERRGSCWPMSVRPIPTRRDAGPAPDPPERRSTG